MAAGEVVLLQGVSLTKTKPLDALNLAIGRDPLSRQQWLVATNEPATLQTFREYSERFQIESELLDEKSNGFQLERSEFRSAPTLSRLCFVMAVAKLLLTIQGQQVVADGKRRWVDAHAASWQQLPENWLELVQGSFASGLQQTQTFWSSRVLVIRCVP